MTIGYFKAIWPLVDPWWPLHDLWPQQCTTLWPGVLFTKFGSHRAFLRQIDLWMTFDPRWGRFENMPTNLVGPSPTPMSTFSSIPQSMAKRIAGHTYTHTHTHTHTPTCLAYTSEDSYVLIYKVRLEVRWGPRSADPPKMVKHDVFGVFSQRFPRTRFWVLGRCRVLVVSVCFHMKVLGSISKANAPPPHRVHYFSSIDYYFYQSIYIAPHEERSARQKKKNEKQRTKIMETSEFSAAFWL